MKFIFVLALALAIPMLASAKDQQCSKAKTAERVAFYQSLEKKGFYSSEEAEFYIHKEKELLEICTVGKGKIKLPDAISANPCEERNANLDRLNAKLKNKQIDVKEYKSSVNGQANLEESCLEQIILST